MKGLTPEGVSYRMDGKVKKGRIAETAAVNNRSKEPPLLGFFVFRELLIGELVFFQCFELGVPVDFSDFGGIVAPAGSDFHEHAEEDFCAEKSFEFLAGLGADFFEHVAFTADENFFLGVAFDEKSGGDFQNFGSFLEFVNDHIQRVRDFVIGEMNGLFANDFAGEESLGLVGDLIFRKIGLAFG